jgi:hypothetical protein
MHQKTNNNVIRTAIESTDLYLNVVKHSRESGIVTDSILRDFIHFFDIAKEALDRLGDLHNHMHYILPIHDEMVEMWSRSKSIKESNISSFKKFIKEEAEFSDQELDELASSITWDDIFDLYNEDELVNEDDEELEEASSAGRRLKQARSMRIMGRRISIARNLKLKRTSSLVVLKKRAVLAARRSLYKKILMGRDKSTLSASEKDNVEARVKRMRFMQNVLAIKLLPVIRKIEQTRISNRSKRK